MVVSWIIDVGLALVAIGLLVAVYYKKYDRGVPLVLAALVVGYLDSFVALELGVIHVPWLSGTFRDVFVLLAVTYGPVLAVSPWLMLADWVQEKYCLPGEPLID